MEKPGIETSGFISDDDIEGVAGCIERVEFLLGPISPYLKGGLEVIIRHFYQTLDQDRVGLKQTRQDLSRLYEQTLELQQSIKNVRKNPSAMWALKLAEMDDFQPNGAMGFDELTGNIERHLKQMRAYVHMAETKLPDQSYRRWPQNLIAERELIKSLGYWYKDVSGQDPKATMKQNRQVYNQAELKEEAELDKKVEREQKNETEEERHIREEEEKQKKIKYSGQFFELIETVFEYLSIRDLSNIALGKLIYESLPTE